MKIKFIISLVIILILTGCDVEYNLDIDKKLNFNETINITATIPEETNDIKNYNYNLPIDYELDDFEIYKNKKEGIEYYTIEKKSQNNLIQFNYEFNSENYEKSNFVNNAFEFVEMTKVGNEYTISTSANFLLYDTYEELENVKIVLTSKYKLISTNADIVEKHKYTWNITKDNATGKYIYLKIDLSEQDLTLRERIENGGIFNIFTVSIIIFILSYLGYRILKKYSNKKDQI